MKIVRRISLCFVLCFMLVGISFAANYDNLITFGNSLTDSGNIYTSLGGAAGWDDHVGTDYMDRYFSNGPVWADYLADRMGVDGKFLVTTTLPGAPVGTMWYNNAFGGAETGADEAPNPLGFLTQIGIWNDAATTIPANSLCVVWIGGNDYLNWDGEPPTPAIQAVANIISGLTIMVNDLDATDIMVINLPDLGKTPRYNGDYISSATATALSNEFNATLETALDAFALATPAVNLMQLDIFSIMNEMTDNPPDYGFLNVADRGIDQFAIDGFDNSGQYLFWDDVHPTTEAHELVADEIYDFAFADDSGSSGCFINTFCGF